MNESAQSSRALTARTPFGAYAVDTRLGGGLDIASLHEIYGDEDSAGSVLSFGFLVALRAAATKPIIIIRDDRCVRAFGRIYGDGVTSLGGNPATIYLVHSANTLSTLRAAHDAVGCSVAGAVIVEPWRFATAYDLTASRRIALRAKRSGMFTLIVRLGTEPTPSAAFTRWRVHSAASIPFEANAPGNPAFDITLLRHRGGVPGFDARVEWNCGQQTFRDAPLSRGLPAVAADRTCRSRELRAA